LRDCLKGLSQATLRLDTSAPVRRIRQGQIQGHTGPPWPCIIKDTSTVIAYGCGTQKTTGPQGQQFLHHTTIRVAKCPPAPKARETIPGWQNSVFSINNSGNGGCGRQKMSLPHKCCRPLKSSPREREYRFFCPMRHLARVRNFSLICPPNHLAAYGGLGEFPADCS
jgi:hypothetical protein